jgi:glycosyltransferase involved in cell wall biosynthesis
MKKRLSVVVPVFNVERYLPKFLSALIEATSLDDELILVNDGSTDGSLGILNGYADRDSRIRLVNQPNAGVSEARNQGLRLANGTWVAFADPDDWMDGNHYNRLIGLAESANAQMIMSNAFYFFERTGSQAPIYSEGQCLPQTTITGKGVLSHCLEQNHLPHMVWMHLYQRTFLTSLSPSFLPETDGNEDVLWTFKVLMSADRVSFAKEPGYYYRVISGRIRSDSYWKHKIEAAVINAKGIVTLTTDFLNEFPEVRSKLNHHVVDGALSIFHHMNKVKDPVIRKEINEHLLKQNFFWFLLGRTTSWVQRKRIIKYCLRALL